MELSSNVKLKLVFPADAVHACLQKELIYIVETRADLQGQSLHNTPAAILTARVPIDSLDVVEILCKLDELVGFDVPQSVVRAGGYDAIDLAIAHLMPRIEKVWVKHKGGTA